MQEFLSSNREALIDKGVLYPYSGRHTERDVVHNAFAAASGQGGQHELPIPMLEPASSLVTYLRQIRGEIREFKPHTVIISSEYFYDLAQDIKNLKRVKEGITFGNIRILLVLRQQDTLAESSYAQRVTGPQRFSGSPRHHLEQLENWGTFDHVSRVGQFETVFGRENVTVYWYEDIAKDLVQPWRDRFPEIDFDELSSIRRSNIRVSWVRVAGTRWANHLRPHDGPSRNAIMSVVRGMERAALLLGVNHKLENLARPYKHNEKVKLLQTYQSRNMEIRTKHANDTLPTLNYTREFSD